jgi:hypothetical protein
MQVRLGSDRVSVSRHFMAEAKSWEHFASGSDDAHLWVISAGHYGGQSQGAAFQISARAV